MARAAGGGARVAHFPEGALSGYAGSDFATFDGFDWDTLRQATDDIVRLAAELGIWVVLGSAHPLTGAHKPHNSLYVISDSGRLIDRYDKRFCSGDAAGQTGDLAYYSPGDHASGWTIDKITCGALICYDYRFPELYRDYCARGVQLMFHSFHAAAASQERISAMGAAIGARYRPLNPAATYTYPGITMPAAMTAAAAANHIWISCPNSSAPESCWPAFSSAPTASPPAGCGATRPECCSRRSTPARKSTTRQRPGGNAPSRAPCTAAHWSAIRGRRTAHELVGHGGRFTAAGHRHLRRQAAAAVA